MKTSKLGLKWHQIIIAIVTICLWIFLFAAGFLINSEPYRNIVSGQEQSELSTSAIQLKQEPGIIKAWIVVIFCYTPTNIIFLTIFAGILGSLSRLAILHIPEEGDQLIIDKTNPIISGAFRGLFVYLLVISGVLVINEAPFITPTPTQYARLSGFMSLISFMLSYNPMKFKNFLASGFDRAERAAAGKKDN